MRVVVLVAMEVCVYNNTLPARVRGEDGLYATRPNVHRRSEERHDAVHPRQRGVLE